MWGNVTNWKIKSNLSQYLFSPNLSGGDFQEESPLKSHKSLITWSCNSKFLFLYVGLECKHLGCHRLLVTFFFFLIFRNFWENWQSRDRSVVTDVWIITNVNILIYPMNSPSFQANICQNMKCKIIVFNLLSNKKRITA